MPLLPSAGENEAPQKQLHGDHEAPGLTDGLGKGKKRIEEPNKCHKHIRV